MGSITVSLKLLQLILMQCLSCNKTDYLSRMMFILLLLTMRTLNSWVFTATFFKFQVLSIFSFNLQFTDLPQTLGFQAALAELKNQYSTCRRNFASHMPKVGCKCRKHTLHVPLKDLANTIVFIHQVSCQLWIKKPLRTKDLLFP